MRELPFKVSAKTARLFGRENVSNAEGAVSELIKNAYDADANMCLVCFLPRYRAAPNEMCHQEFAYLAQRNPDIELYYDRYDGSYKLNTASYTDAPDAVDNMVASLTDLWVIDNGTGMSGKAIEDHWMVIGTNFKEENMVSEDGRVRTGAKGIGRFALDRLGALCELSSSAVVQQENQSITWTVDWSEFDDARKILDEIKAKLDDEANPFADVLTFTSEFPNISNTVDDLMTKSIVPNTGTAIRIGLLRDPWTRSDIDHLFKTLGALIPPLGQRVLDLYLFDARADGAYGVVLPEVLEDYDYKLEAAVQENGEIKFNLYRNELDASQLDPEIFELEEMSKQPFNKVAFDAEKISYTKSINELFPGAPDEFKRNAKELGPFGVNLLFYKKGRPSARDVRIYPYRIFQPGPRKAWLEEFGGLKIYRDNFAVRPYGELGGRAFDWLALGQRVAISPVAASRKGWKVSPQNLAGTVTISRQKNASLNDQSNREGIIENDYFSVFREIIQRIIQEFEDDRSHIHFNINKLHQSKNWSEKAKSEGADTAARITKEPDKATPEDAKQLARAFEAQQDEIRELRDEQTMLRALATLGTVLVSFSHEMGQLQTTMGSRSIELADILSSYIDRDSLIEVGGAFNPYTILDEWEEDDKKVKQWFTFALSSVRSDKRRRKTILLRDHLKKIKSTWKGFLDPREIVLSVNLSDDKCEPKVLAYEIDLDSVFNNLILNSVEALLSAAHQGSREIHIDVGVVGDKVKIDYRDNGPGLDPSITEPANIFKFAVTTKLDGAGEANGTGLGMWILAAVVQTHKGSYRAFRTKGDDGFKMEVMLPLKA